jgi:hypothetical protein
MWAGRFRWDSDSEAGPFAFILAKLSAPSSNGVLDFVARRIILAAPENNIDCLSELCFNGLTRQRA